MSKLTDRERLEIIKTRHLERIDKEKIYTATFVDVEWLIELVEKSIKYRELLCDIANLAYYKEQDAEYYESLLKQVILFARNTLEHIGDGEMSERKLMQEALEP